MFSAKMALGIADRAYVLETGRIVMSGTGQELLNSEDIVNLAAFTLVAVVVVEATYSMET